MENQNSPITAPRDRLRWRRWSFLVVGAAVMAAAWGIVRLDATEKPSAATLLRATIQPLEKNIDVVGTIVDSNTLHVVAPIDSKIITAHFVVGQRVEQGQPLLTLDVAEVTLKARMARLELAKAVHRFAQIRDWEKGIEVTRARRLTAEAEHALAEARQRLTELDTLGGKGIVPRLEHEAGQRQVTQAEAQYHMFNEELGQTLSKGGGNELEVARMDMLAAEMRTVELEQLAAGGVLRAGRSGIILEPARMARADDPAPRYTAGSPIVKGKPLFRIIDDGSVKVLFRLSEIDVNRVYIGQNTEIRGDGFTGRLKGGINAIAAVGDGTTGATASAATFEVHALVPVLNEDQRKQVRLGMSASVTIIESVRSALVLPLRAVGERQGKPVVTVADARSGRQVIREVATGAATADGVEIVAGLQAGELVLVREGL